MQKYLGREEAPLEAETWKVLDATMAEAARSVLAGRRLLYVDGPYGLGLKEVPLQDVEVQPGMSISPAIPIVLLHTTFTLAKRDIAAFERDGLVANLAPPARAAIELALQEDRLILTGGPNIPGLMSIEGASSTALADWAELGTAAGDIINGITALDRAGFHGPYALALTPARYNLLYRRSLEGNLSELEHIQTIVSEGVFKAPALESGGVLIAAGRQFASIVLGQDMAIGFIGLEGENLQFSISESLALVVKVPGAVCTLTG